MLNISFVGPLQSENDRILALTKISLKYKETIKKKKKTKEETTKPNSLLEKKGKKIKKQL